jgi:hypothetical protein
MFAASRLGFIAMVVMVASLVACTKAPETDGAADIKTQAAVVPANEDGSLASGIDAKLCPDPAPCGDNCSNKPYVENDCWTTAHGPPAANIVISASGKPQESTNMLLCDSGPYALCFFSGPPRPTGTKNSIKSNNALPCVVNESGDVADCACQYYTSGISFVDINSIINQNAYYQAVQECGHDGAKCANIQACGSGPGVSTQACGMPEATVCQYVRGQNAQSADQSLVPGYDAISTFSLAMAKDYDMTQVTDCAGPYLGCMTAPCSFQNADDPRSDESIIHCQCPVATGPFQIGQIGSGVQCTIQLGSYGNRYLWSAARTVKHGDPQQDGGG